MNFEEKTSTWSEKIIPQFRQRMEGSEGIVLISALGAIEYAVITTIASGSYSEISDPIVAKVMNFSMVVLCIVIGLTFLVGVLIYVLDVTQVFDLGHTPPAWVIILSKLYFAVITAALIGFVIASFVKGINPFIAEKPESLGIGQYIFLISYVASISIIVVNGFIENRWVFLVMYMLIAFGSLCFFADIFRNAKKESYISNAKYCYSLYAYEKSYEKAIDDVACINLGKLNFITNTP
ncbi:hypothetical protein [Paracoccus sp. JM45]|uniref:hypothetical protein n=1 Tax=Paracoccus sp. JM45 TaxID=2283626 RepID=UPI000EDA4D7A|nr:hypothetical protein [Paracoccus sp. JM45]RJE78660.1 hypothetical protein DWB67_16380 [Paracoccus sp. JM45]